MKVDFKAMLKNVSTTANEHKPEIMTGLGLAFMIGSTVASVVATVKTMKKAAEIKEEKLLEIASNADEYEELSDEDQQRYDDTLNSPVPVKELGKHVWKYWIAPVAGEIVGSALLVGSNRESAKRIGSLAAALAYHVAETADYKEVAKEIIGDKKQQEIEDKVVEKRAKKYVDDTGAPITVIETGTGNDLFYDYYGGRYFRSSMNYIERQVNDLYRDFLCTVKDGNDGISTAFIPLNDFYDRIPNVDRTGLGNEFGWKATADTIELTYGDENAKYLGNGEFYYVIKFKGGRYGLDYLNLP